MEASNSKGSCWTCLSQDISCDSALPHCKNCESNHKKCTGYGVRLQWGPVYGITRTNSPQYKNSRTSRTSRMQNTRHTPLYGSLSTFSLLPVDNRLLQHFLRHISTIALAIDYTENGYRMLTPMALEEPALLNAILAVAAAHLSKWQQVEDTESHKYLRRALVQLQEVLGDPESAVKESTLGTILFLASYEVFNGTNKWKQHFKAVGGWLKLKSDTTNLSSFLKTWICMIDTQAALNIGQCSIPEVEEWLNTEAEQRNNQHAIDPLLGCSRKLPKLMAIISQLEAGRIYRLSKSENSDQLEVQCDIRKKGEALKTKICSAVMDFQSSPTLSVSCGRDGLIATTPSYQTQPDFIRRICAAAEIFRYALLVYVYRVVNGYRAILDMETQFAVDEVYRLLPFVPDAIGPGANLGWALVVVGSETDSPELRQYIRCRWHGLKILELNNNESGEILTEEVWRRRDSLQYEDHLSWQDVMQDIGSEQILV
ncbi:fungal-specific transcription factor domain-containing protein [Leptodontidium sp. 2 PMI_412]|nr:fungal-specific transcription factor domain-containing protein [Leptodontidium sp. 2 PMI_412]